MSELDRALTEVQAWSVDLLARLVAIPSVTGQPSGIMTVLEPLLLDLGFDVTPVPVELAAVADHPEFSPPYLIQGPQPPALHATVAGPPAAELLLFAHTDTEPVHDGWDGDPFAMTRHGGRVHGLGVADDKAGVVSILAALRGLMIAGVQSYWRPRVVLAAGKQGGGLGILQGIRAATGVRAAVYSHPAESGVGLAHLKVASRGIVSLRIEVRGHTPEPVEIRTPVSADPRLGRSAAIRAGRLAAAVDSWTAGGEVWTVVGVDCPARPFEVPAAATVEIACWFTEGTVEDVIRVAVRRLNAAAADDWEREHQPVVTVQGIRSNPASCADSAFARHAADVVAAVSRHRVRGYDWHSASDIRFPMRVLGVPAVGFGAAAGGFYGAGEWVDLQSMHQATQALARLLLTEPPA